MTPVHGKCPSCGWSVERMRHLDLVFCKNKECGFSRKIDDLEDEVKAPFEALDAIEGQADRLVIKDQAFQPTRNPIHVPAPKEKMQLRDCPNCRLVMIPATQDDGKVRWDCMLCPRACVETRPGVFHWESLFK